MAKEAICALLAILGHFFGAFSPLDLFFAPSPFRPVPRPFPVFLHPGCRRFPPLPIPFLHRFQPIPSPARPLKSTSSRPGSHPSRRHPPVLSSSSELLSLSLTVLPHQSPFAPSCVRPPLPAPSTPAGPAPCAPGAFSLTAMISESPRAQKGAWCAPRCSTGRRMFHEWVLR